MSDSESEDSSNHFRHSEAPQSNPEWFIVDSGQYKGKIFLMTSDTSEEAISLLKVMPPGAAVYIGDPVYESVLSRYSVITREHDVVSVADFQLVGVTADGMADHYTHNGVHLFFFNGILSGHMITNSSPLLIDQDRAWFGLIFKRLLVSHLNDPKVYDSNRYQFNQMTWLRRSTLLGNTQKERALQQCTYLSELARVSANTAKWAVAEKKFIDAQADRAKNDATRLDFEKAAQDALDIQISQLAKRRKLE